MVRLSFFRRFARPIALLVLLASPAALQHSGKDDPACGPGAANDDVAALGAAPDDTSDHCLVCHWTRSLRSPSASVARAHAALIPAADVDVLQPVGQRAPALDRAPARAPPPSL